MSYYLSLLAQTTTASPIRRVAGPDVADGAGIDNANTTNREGTSWRVAEPDVANINTTAAGEAANSTNQTRFDAANSTDYTTAQTTTFTLSASNPTTSRSLNTENTEDREAVINRAVSYLNTGRQLAIIVITAATSAHFL